MSATDFLNSVTEAMEVFAELPLRVFDIKISRVGDGCSKIRLTKGISFIEVTGKHGRRIKVTNLLMSSFVDTNNFQIAHCDGLSTVTAACYFMHSVHNDTTEWKSLNEEYSEPPSAKSIKANHAMMKAVAERILTRFSRVDLL